jgi:catechol 2,3-dioxygenase-like lactoylglutathione lyase family enzyme
VPDEVGRLPLAGLHHLTLISSDLERTAAFYGDVLGLTLVEQGRNADDPNARHFHFGDAAGSPGSLVTFIEYPVMPEGQVGRGSTHHFALAVAGDEQIGAWREHLVGRGVPCTDVIDRGNCRSLYCRDPDGHIVELATPGPGYRRAAGSAERAAPAPPAS